MTAERLVPLREIARGRDLAYRDELALCPGAELLRASVRRCGVLQPVQLQQSASGLRPVAGFRRLEVAVELGLDAVPARIGGPAEETFALFCRAVEEHVNQPINLRERLRALAVAEELGAPPSRVCAELLPALGLAAELHLLDDLRGLQALPAALRDLLASKGFSLKRCLPFLRLSSDDGALLCEVARRLGLGGRPIEELLASLLEVAARDQVPLRSLLAELGFLEGSGGAALARLRLRRYPEASRRQRTLEQAADALAKLAGASLRWDPALASETVELSLRVRSVEALRRSLEALGSETAARALERALEEL